MASVSPIPAFEPSAASGLAVLPLAGGADGDVGIAPSAGRSRWRKAWMTMTVQADAFRVDPKAYLQAVVWRIRGLRVRARSRILMLAARSPRAYDLWIERDEPKALAAAAICNSSGKRSRIIIQPVIDCRHESAGLDKTLVSLKRAGASSPPILIGGPDRMNTIRIDEPHQIASVIQSDESWLCLLRSGDRLAPNAFTIYAEAAARGDEPAVIYSDDDVVGPDGRRRAPHFKPGWNPELFEHHDFITGSAIVRVFREDLRHVQGDRWTQTLVGAALRRSTPLHLPVVLHHRRHRTLPVVPEKPASLLADSSLSVTAIVPSRNKVDLLRNCVEGLKRTSYPGLEIIVVDNGSDESETLAYLASLEREGLTILRMPGPFNFSALNNAAVQRARGDFLCFVNNDVEMVDSDWLTLMVLQATRPEIGAVGARLLYPDGTIQHAGVFVGIGGAAGHAHRLQPAEDPGYFNRSRLPQRVSAVTAACLVVAREKFLAVGGFDEEDFPIAFNDVDLCLKLNARGWESFYEPRATLIHHESKSRGSDFDKANRVRFAGELRALKHKWRTEGARDPYHHPHLSRISERFLIAI